MAGWLGKLQDLFRQNGSADPAAASPASAKSPRRQKKDPLGERGENVAAKHLRDKGYRILNRNFKCPVGEIDIIARDGGVLVFCEVKTRAYDEPTPEEQIDAQKMHQLTKAARYYLSRYGTPQPPARFDVVAIVWPQGQPPIVRHVENAFEPTF